MTGSRSAKRPLSGLAGNRYELLAMLCWAAEFCSNSENELDVSLGQENDKGEPVTLVFSDNRGRDSDDEVVGSFDIRVRNYRYLYHLAGTRGPTYPLLSLGRPYC
ncbi:hypothetical protein PENVUL_c034G08100 [Penicillium vulpinum]|uniref:Uncharacterized protein n=1 Tax=Penicillium vulpinum TaxID=29845 RepID=A0A1V6RRC0_9EURO|nr:hypothetical protein PENVUL_c034G08100 [Penicillium vulpinum]